MLPTELECIADDLTKRFRFFLEEDSKRAELPELLSAEQQIVAFVSQLGLDMLQTFVAVRVDQAKAARQSCTCGRVPAVHRTTEWTRQTPLGPIVVRDPYVYCKDCHSSDRPLHALLGTGRETWSLVVEEAAVDLASDESCGKAVAKLERHHHGVEMDRTTALRMLHEHGNKARVFINDKLSEARAVAELPPALRPEGTDKKSRNDTLRLEARYFERNHDAVAYAYYRDNGWSTASSEVESGHRHVVQVRVKISGAWWHPDHVDDILALRMLKANRWWDEYWDTQRAAWRKGAAGFAHPHHV